MQQIENQPFSPTLNPEAPINIVKCLEKFLYLLAFSLWTYLLFSLHFPLWGPDSAPGLYVFHFAMLIFQFTIFNDF